MDIKNLREVLTAANEIGEKLQIEIDELTEENKNLRGEIAKLQEENKNLRTANETFGKNVSQLMEHINKIILDNHEKFTSAMTSMTGNEFKKFFNEYMQKVSDSPVDDKKISPSENENTHGEIILTHAENNISIEKIPEVKQKMIYAEFYAEESRD